VQTIKGSATIASASGSASIGELTGDVKFQSASGGLSVGRLHGDVDMQAASGGITVATAVKGHVSVQNSSGDIELGIAEGTAARLDVQTRSGEISNALDASDGPVDGDETLAVHVRTRSGDITVRRAVAQALS
jgi:DUF4097 and DUF4098 domain-containing protein YvlB